MEPEAHYLGFLSRELSSACLHPPPSARLIGMHSQFRLLHELSIQTKVLSFSQNSKYFIFQGLFQGKGRIWNAYIYNMFWRWGHV